MSGRNSNEDELRREKRSLLGKIKRREWVIMEAAGNIREYKQRLWLIESQLDEYRRTASSIRALARREAGK